mgnify:CR=1 FL=1
MMPPEEDIWNYCEFIKQLKSQFWCNFHFWALHLLRRFSISTTSVNICEWFFFILHTLCFHIILLFFYVSGAQCRGLFRRLVAFTLLQANLPFFKCYYLFKYCNWKGDESMQNMSIWLKWQPTCQYVVR